MIKRFITIVVILLGNLLVAQVSNLSIRQVGKTISFSFEFNAEDKGLDTEYAALIEYSFDGGRSFSGVAESLDCALGLDSKGNPLISKYISNMIDWHVLEDLPDFSGDDIVFRIRVFDTDVIYNSSGSLAKLFVPTFMRKDQSLKATNWMYTTALISGVALLTKNYYYNQYLNVSQGENIKPLYTSANVSNQVMMTGAFVTATIFTIDLAVLINSNGKYGDISRKALR